MRLKTIALVAFSSLSVATAVAIAAPNRAAVIERQIDAKGFTGVSLEGSMDVRIQQGDKISVVARGSQAALDDLEPKVDDGVLRLKQKQGSRTDRLTVTVTMPDLRSFLLAGSGDVAMNSLKADELEIKIAGSGDIAANGTCTSLTINVAGSGNIRAKDLRCDSVAIRIAGSGDVSAYASQSFSARVMGSGDIDVYGNPKDRSKTILGGGGVTYHADAS
ncbi:head GIN domain-containing protein [Pedomonas mirosovicensis]|uniref:head GIN domain-containing protein n=1 Tax=Pedomonas mirosovicensis TaxID=2908641 RepID=UPI002167D72A|nr:head GIN domain-containing protein [Pedomonas mirosovicensis]MCH8684958.1 DUF2807 domain-containing protein [Pedomonas mirosovicensis]